MKAKYLKNVATLRLTKEKCTGCGRCTEVCPHGVFEMRDNKAKIIKKDYCMECGACMNNCPFDALYVKSGVGCAYAMIIGKLTGTEPRCDCSENGGCK